jgi:Na+/H+-translocating membrane pyrophosphatase
MAGMPHEVRDITDVLDAAGNTTAAIGKGFAGQQTTTLLALLLLLLVASVSASPLALFHDFTFLQHTHVPPFCVHIALSLPVALSSV